MTKYKFSRDWYIIKVYDREKYQEGLKWCKEQFGPHPKNPDAWCRWHNSISNKFYFREEKDYMLFLLRWS